MQLYPLLQTKLHIPAVRTELVSRPRLIERLDAGRNCKLTLISAPAGFGKTTLAAEWARSLREAQAADRITWLSLDEGDNDLARFLVYIVAALRTIEADAGKGVLSQLRSPQPPPAEGILTALINGIAAIPERMILILDDYHLIGEPAIHDALAYLLARLPRQMHLVIATREDPHLPLARLRARGQLIELRARDLRFSPSEAAEFLNRVMDLPLSVEDIAALEARTEGWIAGLQLAAISMRGHEDVTGFIQSYTGSHRFVLDYLVEEVLERQPEGIQTFLLQTAILDRFTAPLCDAVTGQHNGQATLERLDRANLFIIPLDNERRWYRFHHLFSDLLRQRLNQTQAEQVPALHLRASEWYEQNGLADEAIEHALCAEDVERAAYLVGENADATWEAGAHTKLQRWLEGLPEEAVLSRPNLCIFRARSLFASGQQEAAEQSLQAAERALGIHAANPAGTWPVEQDHSQGLERQRLQGRIAVIRALMAFFQGDVSAMVHYSREALEYLPEEDSAWRSSAAIARADAHRIQGDIEAAYRARLKALEISRAAGDVYMILVASMKLAVTMRQRGQLEQVKEICEQQLRLASESGLSQSAVAGGFLAIWGEVLAELDDLEEAIHRAKVGVDRAECGEDMVVLGWSYLCLMRVLLTRGDTAGAAKLIRRVKSGARESKIPPWIAKMMAAWQVRLWLAQHRLEAASRWMAERESDAGGELQFLRELEHIVLARILLAQGRLDDTITLLQRLLEGAETGGRVSSAIEILILLSLALEAKGDTDQALGALERALHRAEPGGFIRTFVDEGLPMGHLLYEALGRGIAPEYVRRLLAAFPVAEPATAVPAVSQSQGSDLIEPLSERELEVLQLLVEGLTNRGIAARLVLSLNTVKRHTCNIYGKLGVHSRTQAVARARAIGILFSP